MSLALGYFCRRATVRLDAETLDRIEVTFDDWPSELGKPDSDQHYSYVKNVTLNFGGISDELSKTFVVFADSWIDTMVFPNATEIAVVLERKAERDHRLFSSLSESDTNALQRITESVLKTLPKFSRASIEMRGSAAVNTQNITREVFVEYGLHKLLPSVSAGSATQDTDIESTLYINDYPYLMSAASITRLFYHYPNQGEMAVDVIIRNAPVLVTLVLESLQLPLLKTIMLDKENNPIVYPRLKNFEYLAGWYFGLGESVKVAKGVSFPALERVKCQTRYIFDDDALFRGCGKTLKHLNMQISPNAAKMLVESGVVERLGNLRSINLGVGYQPLIVRDGMRYPLELAFGLVSQSTRSLVLNELAGDCSIAETIAQYPNVQNLVHLNLEKIKLQLTEVMEMMQMLPNLEYFGYACNGLGSALGRVLYKEMPALLLNQYYPLSLRLKYCEINASKRTPTRSLAVTAMLLAILCPRFTYAKVSNNLLAAYNKTIENAITDEPYLEYSDRLQCLLR
ncbi:hypothetical protein H4S06_001048 [Coemansia sp. BCRC 34490]|nr:hypothetical protein H4S06_001048 [Coemansia sp. BCRC 34490]